MASRLKTFIIRHRSLAKRSFLALLILLAGLLAATVYYLEMMNVWRTLFTAMDKWQMMGFIALANGAAFIILLVSLRFTAWICDDD